jgi:hypothetical protein
MTSRSLSAVHPISQDFIGQAVSSSELEKLGGVRLSDRVLTKFYGRARTPSLFIVDGVAMAPNFNVDNLNVNDIESVEAVYDAAASFYGMRAHKGVWIIATKQGKGIDSKAVTSTGILSILPKGFYKAREFYSPKYNQIELKNDRPDLRSTIFWKPELITDKDGNGSFEYYNADGRGSYRIIVEGIDDDGNLGRIVFKYKVK